jgi:zinc/manganese transport system substrate-binding protein
MRRHLAILALALFGLPVTGAESGRLRVCATILPVYCIAANVGHGVTETWYLAGGGGDAHDYQLTPRDRSEIERAGVLLINGLGAEPWLKKVVHAAGSSLNVVDLSRGLESSLLPGTSHAGGEERSRSETNIHVWLDPTLMLHMVTNAMRAFQQSDPAHSAIYATNAAAYAERLTALDASMRKGLQSLNGAALVTFHDAFPYFARRYGLRISGVIEEIPDLDPTPRHLSALREKIRMDKVRAIFVEPRHSRRLADRLGRDLGIKVGILDTLENGPTSATAYEEGMNRNLQSLQSTLR